MKDEINKNKIKEEIAAQEEEFVMTDEEKDTARTAGFNPFLDLKNLAENVAHKYKIISPKILVREIDDVFAGKKTKRMIFTVEDLKTSAIYDIACHKDQNKDGKYSSLTLAVRRLYALTSGNVENVIISITKRTYKHEKYGETTGYTINIINPGEDNI